MKVYESGVTISDIEKDIGEGLAKAALAGEVNGEVKDLAARIREGQMEKVPYMLVIGDKEAESGSVAVRSRGAGDLGIMPADAFIGRIVEEVRIRKK